MSLGTLVLTVLALTSAALDAQDERPPNIVLLVGDDHRHDLLGCAGHPVLQTPHLDELAASGVRFERAFVTTSICAASRATLLTGLWRGTHGYTFGTPPLSEEHPTYPELLRAAGYRTGFVGKLGVRLGKRPSDLFDVFRPLRANPYFVEHEGKERHLTEITGDEAVAFIHASDVARPFCLSVSFNAPHAEDSDPRQYLWPRAQDGLYDDVEIPRPANADPEWFATQPRFVRESLNRIRWSWRFDDEAKRVRMTRGYFRMITGVDAAIGRIIAALEEREIHRNTVVIYIGDNGYFLGDRGFAGKWTIHEESIRVPLIVLDPRLDARDRGRVANDMVLNADIAPTLIALAGVDVPQAMQGRSLIPLLLRQEIAWRQQFFYEHRFAHEAIPKCEGVRGAHYTYVRYYEQDPVYEELYDMRSDPHQRVNLATSQEHAELLAEARSRTRVLANSYGRGN